MKALRKSLNIGAANDRWEEVKDKFSAAVVQIIAEYPRTFLLNSRGSSQGSGFVVDKDKGIILTNKHVLSAGPVRAKARFLRNEEVDLIAVYRDPVHDFAFFKFDLTAVTNTPLVQIDLFPEGAEPRAKVLLMGNNAGEKLTYIEATIGKVDRNYFPKYDCNTFMVVASDISVGGSSGCPVVNSDGRAVALKTWGKHDSNSSFYLPLHRILRALNLYRQGKTITRGTLQTSFYYKTYTEIEHRGISPETLKRHKEQNPLSEGMLVVNKILPKGPGDIAGFENGDVIWMLNGKSISGFVDLAEVLDENIGREITANILRGNANVEFQVRVQDLNAASPSEMIEISNGVLCNMDYIIALKYSLPFEGVILCEMGYMFERCGMQRLDVIKNVGEHVITDLSSLEKALRSYPHGSGIPIKYCSIKNPVYLKLGELIVDKKWFPFVYGKRNDNIGKFEYRDCDNHVEESNMKPVYGTLPKIEVESGGGLASAIVLVDFTSPFHTGDSLNHPIPQAFATQLGPIKRTRCVGVVVSRAFGLVVCDRNVVGSTLGDVFVTFESTLKVSARVVFLSPTSTFAVVQYESRYVESDPVINVSEFEFGSVSAEADLNLAFVGASLDGNIENGQARILRFAYPIGLSPAPYNLELLKMSGKYGQGVYYDIDEETIVAFGLGPGYILPANYVKPHVDMLTDALMQEMPIPKTTFTLPIQMTWTMLSEARSILGLDNEWAIKVKGTSDGRNALLRISRRMIGTSAYDKLDVDDLILCVDDIIINSYKKYVELVEGKKKVKLKLLRQGSIMEVIVETRAFSTVGVTRVVHFAGMVIHEPPPFVYYYTDREKIRDSGVYIIDLFRGSPSLVYENNTDKAAAKRGRLLLDVNDLEVFSLDEFLQAVSKIKNGEYFSINTNNYKTGQREIFQNMRLDLDYWPTRVYLASEEGQWRSVTINHENSQE